MVLGQIIRDRDAGRRRKVLGKENQRRGKRDERGFARAPVRSHTWKGGTEAPRRLSPALQMLRLRRLVDRLPLLLVPVQNLAIAVALHGEVDHDLRLRAGLNI